MLSPNAQELVPLPANRATRPNEFTENPAEPQLWTKPKVAKAEVTTMLKIFLRTDKYLLIVALCISSSAITGCLESSFNLASESRLPRSVTPPPGLTRTDVSVTLNYYTTPLGDDMKFILKDKKGKKLAKIKGKAKCLYPLSGYPAYEVVVVNGITEIIEHRKMEPTFYVTDDPAVRKELLAGCSGHHAN